MLAPQVCETKMVGNPTSSGGSRLIHAADPLGNPVVRPLISMFAAFEVVTIWLDSVAPVLCSTINACSLTNPESEIPIDPLGCS
jgi:hypothetical protein